MWFGFVRTREGTSRTKRRCGGGSTAPGFLSPDKREFLLSADCLPWLPELAASCRCASRVAAADAHRAADAVRRAPQLVHDMPAARAAAAWVSALASDWRRRMGDPTKPVPSLTPGLRLAAAVASHSQRVYSLRRQQLRDVDGFATRDRDPPAHLRPGATVVPLSL